MLQVKYKNFEKEEYYVKISSTVMQKQGNCTFEEYYNEYIKVLLKGVDLKEILTGDFEELLKIKNKIFLNGAQIDIVKKFFNYDRTDGLLSKFQPQISKFFERNLELHTCYYCNIDFINTFKKDDKNKNAFTLDHVLEKADYPYLALSLYNLVPSCYVCNSKVKDSKILFDEFSPTSKEFDFNDMVKFMTFMENPNLQIEKEIDFIVKLTEPYSSKYVGYIKSLNLNSRYDYHKYKVLELIKKRREYPDSKIVELSHITQKSVEDIKQDLFGEYLNDKELYKRPVAKLIKDISDELGLF